MDVAAARGKIAAATCSSLQQRVGELDEPRESYAEEKAKTS